VIVVRNSSTPPGRRNGDGDRPQRSNGGGRSGPPPRSGRPSGDSSRSGSGNRAPQARNQKPGGSRSGEGRQDPDRARRTRQDSRPRTITAVPDGTLPKWVRDEVIRATPKDRRDAAMRQLEVGIAHYAEERYKRAIDHLGQAKALAPQSSIIRELLGLSAYYSEQWLPALQELRAFRRFTGETIHMPVEMDCLRALGRSTDVDKTWELFVELGSDRDTQREAAVVYASHLLDKGRIADAWRIIRPGRLVSPASESEVRRWFVAARVALAAGDNEAAGRLISAVAKEDPALPGLAELQAEL
jgi:tetratricopeptide (TPR) repeat protein